MRWIIGLAAILSAVPLSAQTTVASAVFVERNGPEGMRVEPAATFARGDRVVTVMTWRGSQRADSKIVSAVPLALELLSVSRGGVDYSVDGARTWRTLEAPRNMPPGVTHLRWQADGDGRLTYRAVVR